MIRTLPLSAALGALVALAACSSSDQTADQGATSAAGAGGAASGAGGSAAAGNAGASGAGASTAKTTRVICDGSDAIRLAWQIQVGGTELFYTRVLYELGGTFLYVDGHCHYWLSEPWVDATVATPDNYSAWRPIREGTLTQAQEASLHDAVVYDDFAHDGPPCGGVPPTDGSPVEFWDGESVSSCPGQLQGVAADWPPGRDALYAGGSDMSGPVRIEVGQNTVPDDAFVYPWPLSHDPSYYALDESQADASGVSTRITDAAEVQALRALRAKALADVQEKPGLWYGYVFVMPKGYVVAIRDDVPFAGADGRWAPP